MVNQVHTAERWRPGRKGEMRVCSTEQTKAKELEMTTAASPGCPSAIHGVKGEPRRTQKREKRRN